MSEIAKEVNFDGIVGPTHTYSGLSFGNIASMQHHQLVSNPKEAALQGLAKMKALMDIGLKQGILPPHERPFIPILRQIGYQGNEQNILHSAWQNTPEFLMACSSAASMWAANAATISPSADCLDQKIHFTPANLINKWHRSFEAPMTDLILRKIFSNSNYFHHHTPLPNHAIFADEGAANHIRFCRSYHEPGVELFIFGRSAIQKYLPNPHTFPARQTLEASQAIARLHQIPHKQVVFAQQNPQAIDRGVFHNDVISVGNQNVFFYHEKAFLDTNQTIQNLQKQMLEICQTQLHLIEVKENQISLEEAVATYLFNSQLVSLPIGMALIAPEECRQSKQVSLYLNELLVQKNHPIRQIIFQNVRESMQNGGGPACLRLRVVLNEQELQHVHPQVILTDELYDLLTNWVKKHYRDRLTVEDLVDHHLLIESRTALDELTQILNLGSIYLFQKVN